MKYLDDEIYDKVTSIDGEIYEDEWNECYDAYIQEFKINSNRLPKRFLKEYLTLFLHDYKVNCISLDKTNINKRNIYMVTIKLYHRLNKNEHIITFKDVKEFNINMANADFCSYDILYNEFLVVNDKLMSFEVELSQDSSFKLTFSNLTYRKNKIK